LAALKRQVEEEAAAHIAEIRATDKETRELEMAALLEKARKELELSHGRMQSPVDRKTAELQAELAALRADYDPHVNKITALEQLLKQTREAHSRARPPNYPPQGSYYGGHQYRPQWGHPERQGSYHGSGSSTPVYPYGPDLEALARFKW
jgi:hypothetical protein